MGLLNAMMQRRGMAGPQMGMGGGLTPPMAPMGGGLPGAFSGNPGFQGQLQNIMAGQGPGQGPVNFTPPATLAPTDPPPGTVPGGGGGRQPGFNPFGLPTTTRILLSGGLSELFD